MISTTKTPNWTELWPTCSIDPERAYEIKNVCKRIIANKETYLKIAAIVRCEWYMVGIVHYRESDALTLDVYLHNGDPLGKPTVNEPTGVFFRKDQFIEASVDAMKEFSGCHFPDLFCALAERFNGLGYRHHGIYSPYIVAATNLSNELGKYTSDGHFDPYAHDKQLGVMALLRGLEV